MAPTHVVVLGAGVVGLSTAMQIQDALPGVKVTLVADRFNNATTSDGAAGIFLPLAPAMPENTEKQIGVWRQLSWDYYHNICNSPVAARAGVSRLSGYILLEGEKQIPPYQHLLYCFRVMQEEEVSKATNGKYKRGWFVTTLLVECRKYLPWLMERFQRRGGVVQQRTVNDIWEFSGACDVLVNCTGFGSRALFNDKRLHPVRGQTIRVKAPEIKHLYYVLSENPTDDSTYVIPGADTVLMGGTRQDSDDTRVSIKDKYRIWESCTDLVPSLKGAEVQWDWAGLRPARDALRLEMEIMQRAGKILPVVHNYGHGANGVALGWGTAVEATALVTDYVQRHRAPTSRL